NRTDSALGFRLAPARVVLLDKERQPVSEHAITEAPAPSLEWSVTGERAVALHQPSADFAQQGWEVTKALDGDNKTGWAFAPEMGKAHAAVFQVKTPINQDTGEVMLKFTLKQNHGQQHTLGRFRLSATS